MRTAMDAVIREECEVSVISRDELLEIRQDIRELRADNRRLAEKIDAVARSLIDKINVLRIALREKMDERFRASDQKIESLWEEIDKLFRLVDAKVTMLRREIQEGLRR